MSVKRYDLGGDCDGESGSCLAKMVQVSYGDWVSYEDYAELEKENEQMRKKMTNAITELES